MNETHYRILTGEHLDQLRSLKWYKDMKDHPLVSAVAIRNDEVIGAVSIHPRKDLITMAPLSVDSPIVAIKLIDLLERLLIKYELECYFIPVDVDSPFRRAINKLITMFPDKLRYVGHSNDIYWYKRLFI